MSKYNVNQMYTDLWIKLIYISDFFLKSLLTLLLTIQKCYKITLVNNIKIKNYT